MTKSVISRGSLERLLEAWSPEGYRRDGKRLVDTLMSATPLWEGGGGQKRGIVTIPWLYKFQVEKSSTDPVLSLVEKLRGEGFQCPNIGQSIGWLANAVSLMDSRNPFSMVSDVCLPLVLGKNILQSSCHWCGYHQLQLGWTDLGFFAGETFGEKNLLVLKTF